jgi:hypothetical protein
VLATGPKVRGFKLSQDDGSLKAIKMRRTTSLGREVKPSVPCRKILRHVKERYEYERDISLARLTSISHHVSPDSLLAVSAVICQRDLVDESGIIITHIEVQNRYFEIISK